VREVQGTVIICLLVITFFATALSGPAGLEWLERRRAARRELEDRPVARVIYLPSAGCRRDVGSCPVHRGGEHPCLELDRS